MKIGANMKPHAPDGRARSYRCSEFKKLRLTIGSAAICTSFNVQERIRRISDDMRFRAMRASYYCSGNRPGIQRPASVAGNAKTNGARELSDVNAPASISADVTRRAVRSLAPNMSATAPRASSPS